MGLRVLWPPQPPYAHLFLHPSGLTLKAEEDEKWFNTGTGRSAAGYMKLEQDTHKSRGFNFVWLFNSEELIRFDWLCFCRWLVWRQKWTVRSSVLSLDWGKTLLCVQETLWKTHQSSPFRGLKKKLLRPKSIIIWRCRVYQTYCIQPPSCCHLKLWFRSSPVAGFITGGETWGEKEISVVVVQHSWSMIFCQVWDRTCSIMWEQELPAESNKSVLQLYQQNADR